MMTEQYRRNVVDKITLTCEVGGGTFDWLRAQAKAGRMTMGQALDLLVACAQDTQTSPCHDDGGAVDTQGGGR